MHHNFYEYELAKSFCDRNLEKLILMVSVVKGMTVQPSRFAVLSLGDQSDSEEEGSLWQVAQPKVKRAIKNNPAQQQDDGKSLSKNAKKRARKKRNKSTSSDNAAGAGTPLENEKDGKPDDVYDKVWKQKNEEALEEDYQKDLREALLMSAMEKRQAKEEQLSKDNCTPDVKPFDLKSSKKPVKLTLQELHQLPGPIQDTEIKSAIASKDIPSKQIPGDAGLSSLPLEDIEDEIAKEVERDKIIQTKVNTALSEEDQSMLPRLAHLEDKLEKKDKTIFKLKKENDSLKKALKEVKERNQSLCTIMSQGEFSEKADLVRQVDDLSMLKDDLTLEIESLSTALEQEKTKNKLLRADLLKFQTLQSKAAKQSSH